VSQIFDSLRRARRSDAPFAPARNSHGDAVLATLGYAPTRRRRQLWSLLNVAVIVGLVALSWFTWSTFFGAVATVSLRQTIANQSRPAPPLPRPAPPVLPSAPDAPIDSPLSDAARAAPPPAQSGVVSDLGSRPSQAAAPSRDVPDASRTPDAGPRTADPRSRTPDPGSRTPDAGSRTTDPGSRNADPDKDLSLAVYYHRAGDFANALQHYRAVLDQNELNAQAHNNLGLLYQEKHLLVESARELQRAALIEPRNAGTHNNYGVTLLMLGRLDESAAEFHTALSIDPRHLDALINLSLAQRQLGQLGTAKETLLRVLNLAPQNAAAHYNLAQLYDQTGEPARAVEHYRMFLAHAGPEYADRGAAVRTRIAALNRKPD
jgi:Tfp pilus assembly protein PilF